MIRFENVKKTYPSGVEALKGVDFEIENGEFVFIIGKSGSGKSTLLKCITREEKPTEGKVTIDNFDISHMSRALVPTLRRQIGMIYQDFRLIETKTVAENIAFAGEIIGVPKKSLDQSVSLVLGIVGLKSKADCLPQELSGGEQQRVAIARAMINNPTLIVADEPTGNLDPETSENIMALLLEINKTGTTVVICTHDSNLVDRMKQRVIEIEKGYLVRDELSSSYNSDNKISYENTEFGGYGIDDYAEYDNFEDTSAESVVYEETITDVGLLSEETVSALEEEAEVEGDPEENNNCVTEDDGFSFGDSSANATRPASAENITAAAEKEDNVQDSEEWLKSMEESIDIDLLDT